MMKCIRGKFEHINRFITEEGILIYVYPWQNLWREIKANLDYEVFIQIDEDSIVKDVVYV